MDIFISYIEALKLDNFPDFSATPRENLTSIRLIIQTG